MSICACAPHTRTSLCITHKCVCVRVYVRASWVGGAEPRKSKRNHFWKKVPEIMPVAAENLSDSLTASSNVSPFNSIEDLIVSRLRKLLSKLEAVWYYLRTKRCQFQLRYKQIFGPPLTTHQVLLPLYTSKLIWKVFKPKYIETRSLQLVINISF